MTNRIQKKFLAVNHKYDIREMYVVDGIYIFSTEQEALNFIEIQKRL